MSNPTIESPNPLPDYENTAVSHWKLIAGELEARVDALEKFGEALCVDAAGLVFDVENQLPTTDYQMHSIKRIIDDLQHIINQPNHLTKPAKATTPIEALKPLLDQVSNLSKP